MHPKSWAQRWTERWVKSESSFQHICGAITLQTVTETGSAAQNLHLVQCFASFIRASLSLERLGCLNSQTHQQETANALLTLSACVHLCGCICASPSTTFGHYVFSPQPGKSDSLQRKCLLVQGSTEVQFSISTVSLYPLPSCCCPNGPAAIAAKHFPSRSVQIQIYAQQKSLCKSKRIVWKVSVKKKKKSLRRLSRYF